MLCVKCKKNPASRTYEQMRNGKVEYAYYCLKCDEILRQTTYADTACSYCGTTLAQFKKTKLVGCAWCYQTLFAVISPVIERMQGGEMHRGKCAYKSPQERVRQRCEELSTLATRKYSEDDDEGAGVYEEKIDMLRKGVEEDFVWKETPKYNP